MKDLKKWFENQNIEPIQDRNDGMDYHENYELYTYNDLMECMEALLILHDVVVPKGTLCECKKHSLKTNYGFEVCTKCGNEFDD